MSDELTRALEDARKVLDAGMFPKCLGTLIRHYSERNKLDTEIMEGLQAEIEQLRAAARIAAQYGVARQARSDALEEAATITTEPSVNDIPDSELVRRAVASARGNYRMRVYHPRWCAVMDTFGLGSTYAHQLCRKYGFDPYEEVKR